MSTSEDRTADLLAEWCRKTVEIDATPLLLIVGTTNGKTHRLSILAENDMPIHTILAILQETLQSAFRPDSSLDLLIAPASMPRNRLIQ
jgi:hypothetical protein